MQQPQAPGERNRRIKDNTCHRHPERCETITQLKSGLQNDFCCSMLLPWPTNRPGRQASSLRRVLHRALQFSWQALQLKFVCSFWRTCTLLTCHLASCPRPSIYFLHVSYLSSTFKCPAPTIYSVLRTVPSVPYRTSLGTLVAYLVRWYLFFFSSRRATQAIPCLLSPV